MSADGGPGQGKGGEYHPGADLQGGFTSLLRAVGASSSIGLDDAGDTLSLSQPTESAPPDLPEKIGRFHILGEIGRGGIGIVYRVHDPELGRDLALKLLLPRFVGIVDLSRRFIEESQIGGQLQHPGIVPIHEMGVLPGPIPYFTMKLVKGKTLAALIAARRAPEEDRQTFLSRFESIAQTLAYAHSRGVIHRDLKPSNVMVGAFGEVQVMDWGLAKVLAEGGIHDERRAHRSHVQTSVSLIRTIRSEGTGTDSMPGTVMGTPCYMPPEQARGAVDDLDERSDVFGLGAILCEILTGAPPYSGPTPTEVQRSAEEGDLADAYARIEASGAAPELISLARECLAADPRNRPRDAGVVAKVLRAYFDTMDRRVRDAEKTAAAERVRARGERRAKRITAGIALAVLLAAGAGGAGTIHWRLSRAERAAEDAAAAGRALGEARSGGAEARSAGSRGLALWPGAIESAARAEALLAAAENEALRGEAALLRADLERDQAEAVRAAAELEKEGALAEKLLLVRLRQPHAKKGEEARIAEDYAEAFREHGIDPGSADFGKRLAGMSIALDAARAVDDWAAALRKVPGTAAGDWQKLHLAASEADPDEVSVTVRRALIAGDREPVLRAARGIISRPILPPGADLGTRLVPSGEEPRSFADPGRPGAAALDLLCGAVAEHRDLALAVRLAMRVSVYHPADLALHHRAGSLMFARGRFDEALGHFLAVRSLRKDLSHAWRDVGLVKERHDWDEAASAYRRAVELHGAEPGVGEDLARSLREILDFAGCAEAYRKLVEREPLRADLRQSLGEALLRLKDHEGAAAALRESLTLDGSAERTYELLGEALQRAGRHPEAAAVHTKALDTLGESADRLFRLGRSLLDAGRTTEASSFLGSAAGLRSSHAETQLLLGISLGREGNLKGCSEALRLAARLSLSAEPIPLDREAFLPAVTERARRRAHRSHPERWREARGLLGRLERSGGDTGSAAVLGTADLILGDIESAAERFRAALGDAPADALAIAGLAASLQRRARGEPASRSALLEEARDRLERALVELPGDGRLLEHLASILHDLGRGLEAMGLLRKVLEADPGNIEARINLARALYREGRLGDAEKEAMEALSQDETHFGALIVLAAVGVGTSQGDAHIRRLLALYPEDPWALMAMAVVHTEKGRLEEALPLFEDSLRREPLDARARLLEGTALLRLGRSEEAIRSLDAAMAVPGVARGAYAEVFMAHLALGRPCRALDALARGISGMPERIWDRHEAPIAEVLREEKGFESCPELEAAIHALESALRTEPERDDGVREALLETWLRNPSLRMGLDPIETARRGVSATGGGDPKAFHLLARVLEASGRKADAIGAYEEAQRADGSDTAYRDELEALRSGVFPDLPTLRTIDAFLDRGDVLLARDAPWRLLPGFADASEGVLWAAPGFDDSGWREGRGPFGFGNDIGVRTAFEELQGEEACLYLRAAFSLDRLDRYRRVLLALRVDDGLIVHVNGREGGRIRAGSPGSSAPHDLHASDFSAAPLEEEIIELPSPLLREGENVLALQLLGAHAEDDEMFLEAEVRGERRADGERERLAAFRAMAEASALTPRLEYIEGRLLAREGKHAEAVEAFARAASNADGPEPMLRLRESLHAMLGRREGDRAVRERLADLPIPPALSARMPEAPRVERVETAGSVTVLEIAPSFSFGRDLEQTRTLWEVRPLSGAIEVYTFSSAEARDRLHIPPGLLLPDSDYGFRTVSVSSSGRRSEPGRPHPFRTGSFHLEVRSFDLSKVFTSDVIANPGDTEEEPLDHGDLVLGVEGWNGSETGRSWADGVPADGRIGVHRMGSFDGKNALQLSPGNLDPLRISAPAGRFNALRFLLTGGGARSVLPLTIEQKGGEDLRASLPCPVWTESAGALDLPGAHLLTVRTGLDVLRVGKVREHRDENDRSIFEVFVPLPPDTEMTAIILAPEPSSFFRKTSRFNLFAVTAVSVKGSP